MSAPLFKLPLRFEEECHDGGGATFEVSDANDEPIVRSLGHGPGQDDDHARDEAITRAIVRTCNNVPDIIKTLQAAQTALHHFPPGDCWSTGPMTGTPMDDICIGCAALKAIKGALADLGVTE